MKMPGFGRQIITLQDNKPLPICNGPTTRRRDGGSYPSDARLAILGFVWLRPRVLLLRTLLVQQLYILVLVNGELGRSGTQHITGREWRSTRHRTCTPGAGEAFNRLRSAKPKRTSAGSTGAGLFSLAAWCPIV